MHKMKGKKVLLETCTYLLNTVGVVRGVGGASCKVRSRDVLYIM